MTADAVRGLGLPQNWPLRTLCDKEVLSALEPVGGRPVELWLLCVGELHDGSSLFRLISTRPIAEGHAHAHPPGRTGDTSRPGGP